jgi:hypothetical protein
VDGQVQSHQLDELGVIVAQELGEISTVVQVGVNVGDLAVFEDVAVDTGSNVWQFGNQVIGILVHVLPVLSLRDTVLVGFRKTGLLLKGSHSQRELAHGVEGVGATINNVLDVRGNGRSRSPISRELLDLLLGRNLTSNEEPEKTFGQQAIAFGNREWSFLGIECPNFFGGNFEVAEKITNHKLKR